MHLCKSACELGGVHSIPVSLLYFSANVSLCALPSVQRLCLSDRTTTCEPKSSLVTLHRSGFVKPISLSLSLPPSEPEEMASTHTATFLFIITSAPSSCWGRSRPWTTRSASRWRCGSARWTPGFRRSVWSQLSAAGRGRKWCQQGNDNKARLMVRVFVKRFSPCRGQRISGR